MRMGVMTLLPLLLGAGSALAQTGALPSAPAPASPKATMSPGPPAKGGADDAVAECMRLWDAATHMSKQEWSRTCRRIQTRLDSLKLDSLDFNNPNKSARKKGRGG